MATPTPNAMKANPSQQGRTPSGIPAATPPVSTPFSTTQAHAAFSPRGPKSSPQHFKKSPATSATIMGHPGNPPLNFDSPSAAAAMGALGIGAGLDINLDNVGVAGLGNLGGVGTEDDRIKRLDSIIEILGAAKGRVSEAGLERLSHRTGLNKMWEDHRTPGGKMTRTLIIAGHGLQIDIGFDNNIVQSVTVAFPESESTPTVTKHADRAGRILLEDLRLGPNQSPLTKKLDKFAANLERLALLDKLSVFPGLDCQEAVAGIYESLEKLYKWELAKARGIPDMAGKSEALLERNVLCCRSGRPAMHMRGRVGLSLDYWVERRLVPPSSSALARDSEKQWTLLLGCKALDGEMYHPIRISANWISDKIEKAISGPTDMMDAAGGPLLDWLDPEPTPMPQVPDGKNPGVEVVRPDGTTQKLPNVKFVATLCPPVVVPQSVCNILYGLTGAQPPPVVPTSDTFDSIVFPMPTGSIHDASELRTVSCERQVLVKSRAGGGMETRRHENTLFVYKPVYGQTITELPFSHPQQLVAMLPTLRQYAFISSLLARSFGASIFDEDAPEPDESMIVRKSSVTRQEDLEQLLAERRGKQRADDQSGPMQLDVVLSVHPTAGLNVVFPFRDATANIDLQIQPNGVVHVVSQNVLPPPAEGGNAGSEDGQKRKLQPQDLGRLLETFEDLCQWAEWIRTRLS